MVFGDSCFPGEHVINNVGSLHNLPQTCPLLFVPEHGIPYYLYLFIRNPFQCPKKITKIVDDFRRKLKNMTVNGVPSYTDKLVDSNIKSFDFEEISSSFELFICFLEILCLFRRSLQLSSVVWSFP